VSASQEKDYVEMLQAFHESIKSLDLLPDYQPVVDYERFARRNVCRVEPQNNVLGNAWSYTFSIKDQSQQDLPTPVGLLHNKTVCLKDCITVAG
jgi:amidase